jgi:tRNA threonylcarbamoyladenosine biosynthesis protein TsaB
MRILGFDTATAATAVALWDESAGIALEARDDPPPGARPRHATRLMPLITQLLDRGATAWTEIDRIAVGLGPGTFTGLRIAIATARAVGQARGLPLVGISTLQSLALGGRSLAHELEVGAVVAVIDARRGEAFAASWPVEGLARSDAVPLVAPRALAPQALTEMMEGLEARALAVGDGAVKFRTVLERSGASIPEDSSDLHRVSATNHCRLAGDRRASARDQIRPEYLRPPDAEISRSSARHR